MSINCFEQIYTSAARLLQGAHGDLGVVAQSKQFPPEVSEQLKSIRSYHILDSLRSEPTSMHPPRFWIGPGGRQDEYFCCSRVVFAGADHTGRTTPLAHHLVFEQQQLKSQGVSLTQLLLSAATKYMDRWQPPPQWLPPQSLKLAPETTRVRSASWNNIGDDAFARMLGAFATQYLDSFTSKRQIVFALPVQESTGITDNLVDLLQYFPAAFQYLTIQTHVIDSSELAEETRLIFTYPDTPFMAQAKHRKDSRAPAIFDVSRLDLAGLPVRDFGQWIEQQVLENPKAGSFIDAGKPAKLFGH